MRKFLIILLAGTLLGSGLRAQGLQEYIRLAQDSTITAFQSQYEYQHAQSSYDLYLSLRKPQLSFNLQPNYSRYINDPSRNYVYMRDYDILSSSAQLKMSQKLLGIGGEAYVASQFTWSHFFNQTPRYSMYAVMPVVVGANIPLIGYNPYKWKKKEEEQALKAARLKHQHSLYEIAEETARRYFSLVTAQQKAEVCQRNLRTSDTLYAIAKEKFAIAVISKGELLSLELQCMNAKNALDEALVNKEVAKDALISWLRIEEKDLPETLPVPQQKPFILISMEEALAMSRETNPAYQKQLGYVTQAEQARDKAQKESGLQVGVDLNLGIQQVNQVFAEAFKNQHLYALGSVSLSVPLIDFGAAKNRRQAAQAWLSREESLLRETERQLEQDVISTVHDFSDCQERLRNTGRTVEMAEEVFSLISENYAQGFTDINSYVRAQNHRDEAYSRHLATLQDYWITYYHLATLTLHEY
jgi:outer membrane protein TolC